MKEISKNLYNYPMRALNNCISKMRTKKINPSDIKNACRYKVKLDTTEIEKFAHDSNFTIRKGVYDLVYHLGDSKKIIDYLLYEIDINNMQNGLYLLNIISRDAANLSSEFDKLSPCLYSTFSCDRRIKLALIDLFIKGKRNDLLLGMCFDSNEELVNEITKKLGLNKSDE